jgi:leader peptidase (prepilin peptidase) / N-methyltransferase
LFYLLYQVSNGRWIGGGDVKLAFVLSLLVAKPTQAFLVLFIASLIGTIISLPLMVTGKLQSKSRIPFGPLLLTATYIVYLFGNELADSLSRVLVGV